ncbi:MAG TPA: CDP-alcohol phosphatidyltransferase family protein [Acetobacteraceae bacterium]|nr:CDP-alcohol phosphatidyltransferase family protein [Acetobacteraceae bacterium]
MEAAEPVRRTSEIEEVTNLYFIHPIASRLTPLLANMHVHPNAVSVAGMLFGMSAGFAYCHYQDLRYAIAGFILMIAWHVMDGADGQLARLTHSQSETGKILDGICDYVTFIAVYTGLAVTLSRQYGGWVWILVIAAGACHAVQAAAYEVQRQEYNFWGWGRKSAELLELHTPPGDARPASLVRWLPDLLHRLYARVQFLVAGAAVEFHKRLAATLQSQPERTAAIRQRYREVFAPRVRRWSVMSANYRTLGIFVFALLKAPLYYFWFEIFGFGAILIGLLAGQRARNAQFFKELDTVE